MRLVSTTILLNSLVAATCYYRNGNVAVIGSEEYEQCPGSSFRCLPTDSCASNGLCIDINNHANGSLTSQGNGVYYNFTGLYQTPACVDSYCRNCDTECAALSTNASSRSYIWACNTGLTDYCCASGSDEPDQGSCCNSDTNFALASPTTIAWSSTVSATATAGTTTAIAVSTSAVSSPDASCDFYVASGPRFMVIFRRQSRYRSRCGGKEA
ncbi:hypothetical protein Tdes44962_MAKER07845 [Teratosphaeria destructans]|uniref:Uncharacterized protein n=1 Tax=Teratosphaeria destructans TaxID=418781 RepID=A0A9W7SYQ2_9PEZI|nr:hypothetical protein Tdes44962_MAKER07845 [Teratosphaeria destructans]